MPRDEKEVSEEVQTPAQGWPLMDKAAALAFRAFLKNPRRLGQGDVVAVGQSHLDAAWRWRAGQTHDKAYTTFRQAVRHIRHCEGFSFSQSQPQYYEWIRQEHPALFKAVQEQVAAGRWELVGGMWIEPDCNLSGGESLVRQRLHGQRFYLRHFGRLAQIEWLPDTFGFCHTLPQILARSGAKYFWTSKIFWNDSTRFPADAFWWQSPDGSRVLSLFSPTYLLMLPLSGGAHLRPIPLLKQGEALSLDYGGGSAELKEAWSKDEIPAVMLAYGYGDGGAGPLDTEIDTVQRFEADGLLRQGKATEVFAQLETVSGRLPVWNDELYLEFHRGCYTTQAAIKRMNRLTETRLLQTETLAVLSGLDASAALEGLWKKHLFQQFHDILPGSGIPEVVLDTLEDYRQVHHELDELQKSGFAALAEETDGKPGQVVVNTLAAPRQAVVVKPLSDLPVTWVSDERVQVWEENGQSQGAFFSGSLPPVGWLGRSAPGDITDQTPVRVREEDHHILLSNGLVQVGVDRRTGCVTSLRHLPSGPETLSGPCRLLLFREDPGLFPAWNLDHHYEDKPLFVEDVAGRVQVLASGPLTAVVAITRQVAGAVVHQRVRLDMGSPWVDMTLNTNWVKKKTLLKAAFPVAVQAPAMHYEIPFGVLRRPVTPVNPFYAAQWERPMQRWVDFSDGHQGLAVLSDGPHGFNVKNGECRLSLLRSARYPTAWLGAKNLLPKHQRPRFTDLTEHTFRYGLLPHGGDWQSAGLMEAAQDFSTPVLTGRAQVGGAAWGSLFSLEGEGVTVVAVKPLHEEDGAVGECVVIRLLETRGEAAEVALHWHGNGQSPAGVQEVDLLELNPSPLVFEDKALPLRLGPWELKTLVVKMK